MNLRNYCYLVILALALPGSLNALEITGTVREVTGDTAMVMTDGDVVPSVGNKVDIFFKLPGADEEISVASGKVTEVNTSLIKIKIENATGTISKGQFARFKTEPSQKKAAASTSPATSSADKSAAHPSITGNWVGTVPNGSKISFTFKDDQTVVWSDVESGFPITVHAKYRTDYTAKPHHIDIFDCDQLDRIPKGETLFGLFEFKGDSRLKMDLSIGEQANRDKGFTDGAIIFSRVP